MNVNIIFEVTPETEMAINKKVINLAKYINKNRHLGVVINSASLTGYSIGVEHRKTAQKIKKYISQNFSVNEYSINIS